MAELGLHFQALYGTSSSDPVCFLLSIDGYKILLDCGWTCEFNEESLEPLRAIVNEVDCVLVSHSDLQYMGALPYAVRKLGLKCPIYATIPTAILGKMALQEAVKQHSNKYKFGVFSLADIDEMFGMCTQVKYGQEIALTGRGNGITLIPNCAGHTLGGSFWQINKENQSLIYALHFHHSRERHLDGTVLLDFPRPTVLITDASWVETQEKRKARDIQFLTSIEATIKSGGTAVIPVPPSRIPELALVLSAFWDQQNYWDRFPLVLLGTPGSLSNASTLIEWCSEACRKIFDDSRENPFTIPKLRRVPDLQILSQIPQAKVVLVVEDVLFFDLIKLVGKDPKSLIMFTNRSSIYDRALSGSIEVTEYYNEDLTPEEKKRYIEEKRDAMNKPDLEEDQDDTIDNNSSFKAPTQSSFLSVARIQILPKYPMFPSIEPRIVSDIYGGAVHLNVVEEIKEESKPVVPVIKKEVVDETEKFEFVKVASRKLILPISCKLEFVDLEGRSDVKSIRNIIDKVEPRKLILIHGSDSNKQALKTYVEGHVSTCRTILIPQVLQNVDITADLNVITVKLKDSLDALLSFRDLGDNFAVSRFEAMYDVIDTVPTLLPVPISEFDLDLPVVSLDAPKFQSNLFLGDVKLADIKRALNQEAINAEFVGGVLVCCEGLVNIRKVTATLISITGCLCEDYFRTRDILYRQYETI